MLRLQSMKLRLLIIIKGVRKSTSLTIVSQKIIVSQSKSKEQLLTFTLKMSAS